MKVSLRAMTWIGDCVGTIADLLVMIGSEIACPILYPSLFKSPSLFHVAAY